MRILVAVEPVDLRKGIDGLAALCREKLQSDPFSGCLEAGAGVRGVTIGCVLVADPTSDGCPFPYSNGVVTTGRHYRHGRKSDHRLQEEAP